MVGLLPQWMWNMAFMLCLLNPGFRKSRRWAEQLLDHTVEAVRENIQESREGKSGPETQRYKSFSQRLAYRLPQDDAVGETYGFS